MNYNWNWSILATDPYTGWILSGLMWTILVALAAWVIAFTLGSAIGILRTLENAWARRFAVGYVAVFRNIPLLVQMFLWYFVFPEILPETAGNWVKRDIPNPEYWTAVVCLGMYTAARVSEQVRSGIELISKGQKQAAKAVGLRTWQIYRYVLLPICYRVIVPPLTSEFLGAFKNSSLALTIGVLELTAQTRQIEEYTFQGFEAFTAATVLYITITMLVMTVMKVVEMRTMIPGMISVGAK